MKSQLSSKCRSRLYRHASAVIGMVLSAAQTTAGTPKNEVGVNDLAVQEEVVMEVQIEDDARTALRHGEYDLGESLIDELAKRTSDRRGGKSQDHATRVAARLAVELSTNSQNHGNAVVEIALKKHRSARYETRFEHSVVAAMLGTAVANLGSREAEALALYTEALQMNPENKKAKEGKLLLEVRAKLKNEWEQGNKTLANAAKSK